MIDNPQHDYKFTELDPDLLSTPFGIQTNWHVITGAPCSGKSTLIGQLAKQGFKTVPESARLYIEREMANGRSNHPIRVNGATLQRNIKDMQLRIEDGLQVNDVLFLDGAVPGSLAWYRVYGVNPNEILLDCFRRRYASVFMLDLLPFQPDEERVDEMVNIARYLDEWHTRDYTALGYNVVRVPVLPTEARLGYVLERFSKPGLR
jgi:predicted ATPase